MLRSSSSGLSATTSACGGSVRGGSTSTSLKRVGERHLGCDQRVGDAVVLRPAGRGQQPLHDAAEADDADAVAPLEVLVRERRGGAHGQVERALALAPHLGEAVEEEDDVAVPLRVLLVHVQLAAARADAPVHAAHAVARRERPQVGELDALAAGARDAVAGERLRLERADERAQPLGLAGTCGA